MYDFWKPGTESHQVHQAGLPMTINRTSNPLDKLPPILKKDMDRNLCTCNGVPKMDIINAIVNGATTVDEVKKQTYATDGTVD